MFDKPIPRFLEEYLGEPDEVVRDWPGLGNPTTLIALYIIYATVLSCGRRFMKNFTPFRLRGILICYNIVQIILCSYILVEIIICVSNGEYSLLCAPSPKTGPITTRLARAVWLFYISKMVDLMDTVFFVLRKKNEQITFLHVYHHVAMVIAWYLGALYTPGGQAWLTAAINAGIHVLMYFYYLISAMGPTYRKYLWWKKYLTQIQLVQFVIVGTQVAYLLYNGCARPMWLAHSAFIYNVTLISLFSGFYRKAYHSGERNVKFDSMKNYTNMRWIDQQNGDKKRS